MTMTDNKQTPAMSRLKVVPTGIENFKTLIPQQGCSKRENSEPFGMSPVLLDDFLSYKSDTVVTDRDKS